MGEPILYHAFDKAYDFASHLMPVSFQEHPELLASGFGFLGGYALTRGIQFGIKKISPTFYNDYLPKIEKGLAYLVCATPLLYHLVDPQGLEHLMTDYPVYTPGVSAGIAGSATAAFQDSGTTRFRNELYKKTSYSNKRKTSTE